MIFLGWSNNFVYKSLSSLILKYFLDVLVRGTDMILLNIDRCLENPRGFF